VTEEEAKAAIAAHVSRETMEKLETYVETLARWQPKVNLVANATLPEVWSRHILDSLQLLDAAPITANLWLDLGSGGGFPGLPCAISANDYGVSARFELVESDTRKCAFLQEVARQTRTDVIIHNTRIEALQPAQADIVSARALAPLSRLLDWAHPHMAQGCVCLLQKGANHALELETARADWQMDVERLPSMTAEESVILRIRNLSHV
jgi:16S rRNA (guanine527-N7)-methyltransferase